MTINQSEKVSFIWNCADILRGHYKQGEYGKVILPLMLLRRMDCALADSKELLIEKNAKWEADGIENRDKLLKSISEVKFYNISLYDFEKLASDPNNILSNFMNYLDGYSDDVKDIVENFKFREQVHQLHKKRILYPLIQKFLSLDLHPTRVSNIEMGYIFEEILRRFSEMSNDTAGEHYSPREAISLLVGIVMTGDKDALDKKGKIKTVYDPTCGTGGMLSTSEAFIEKYYPHITLELFGQELNDESYAIAKADMLIKGYDSDNIKLGDTLINDQLEKKRFHYMFSNPPYGTSWGSQSQTIKQEAAQLGFDGRFGAGTPRTSDGSLLFLQHMISKMRADGSRIGIILNGSPLFTGDAGSGESNIRKWLLEKDLVEAIIALPEDLFYNTGITTYIWILDNTKEEQRKGKIQLIDATGYKEKLKKALGNKRNIITSEQIKDIISLYEKFENNGTTSKIFPNTEFFYKKITVERPLRRSFEITDDAIDNMKKLKQWNDFSNDEQKEISKAAAILNNMKWSCQKDFFALVKTEITMKWTAKLEALLINAFGKTDETAELVLDKNGKPQADTSLRDTERVPYNKDINEYMKEEVLPHVPDAWVDESKTTIGCEINFNRYFYKYTPLRSLEEVQSDLKTTEAKIQALLNGMV